MDNTSGVSLGSSLTEKAKEYLDETPRIVIDPSLLLSLNEKVKEYLNEQPRIVIDPSLLLLRLGERVRHVIRILRDIAFARAICAIFQMKIDHRSLGSR